MRRINARIAIALAVLAALVWLYVCYYAVTFQTQADYSRHFYPARLALTLTVAACLGWVLVTWQSLRGDGETRCRKCGYILRGLSAPRCPECGTAI